MLAPGDFGRKASLRPAAHSTNEQPIGQCCKVVSNAIGFFQWVDVDHPAVVVVILSRFAGCFSVPRLSESCLPGKHDSESRATVESCNSFDPKHSPRPASIAPPPNGPAPMTPPPMNTMTRHAFVCLAIAMMLPPSVSPAEDCNTDPSAGLIASLPPLFDDSTPSALTPSQLADLQTDWLATLTEQIYGEAPATGWELSTREFDRQTVLDGRAVRRQLRSTLSTPAGSLTFEVLLHQPSQAAGDLMTFVGLNFYGNHTTTADPAVAITSSWCRSSKEKGVVDHRATAAGRGASASRWAIERVIDGGCAIATIYCGDFDPDFDDDFQNGVHALFPGHRPSADHAGRWGTIAAWAWGLSRAVDAMEQTADDAVTHRCIAIGHSRLGKTALWAGATDRRFVAAISNDSGCGGAALSVRRCGETVARINKSFPHWFCGQFKQYNDNEAALPVDQHHLIACIAPRPVYVASASEDLWADPLGEFQATQLAGQAYLRAGLKGLSLTAFPQPDTASIGLVSYHLRSGKHDITAWDWDHYLQFAEQVVESN